MTIMNITSADKKTIKIRKNEMRYSDAYENPDLCLNFERNEIEILSSSFALKFI